jgi:hypothetical protein
MANVLMEIDWRRLISLLAGGLEVNTLHTSVCDCVDQALGHISPLVAILTLVLPGARQSSGRHAGSELTSDCINKLPHHPFALAPCYICPSPTTSQSCSVSALLSSS